MFAYNHISFQPIFNLHIYINLVVQIKYMLNILRAPYAIMNGEKNNSFCVKMRNNISVKGDNCNFKVILLENRWYNSR